VDVIPNGYDPEDFGAPPAERAAEEVLVVHSGSFRARPAPAARGGLRRVLDRGAFAPVPFDLSTHSPEPLFRAMAAVKDTCRVRARLVGSVEPGWLERAEAIGVGASVEALGYRPHRESIGHLLAADLLYLPTITRLDGASVSNVPAKTYEYLGSGRPVAALAGPGDVRDLASGRVRVALLGPRDDEGLAELLRRAGEPGGLAATPPDPPDTHALRRREVARLMAETLRRAVSPRSDSCAAGSESDEKPCGRSDAS
jgi:glycosyltransferase involved in cell wall biosynthesis